MKTKILISLIAIVALAGCTIPGIQGIPGIGTGPLTTGGGGLEITSFTVEPDTLFSGSNVRIILEVANNGGITVPINKAMAQIIGNLEFSATPSSTLVWHDTKEFQLLKEMKSEDVVRGLSAGTDRIMWTLTSPTLSSGQTRTDSFTGRVYSEYQTVAQGTIWAYTDSEAEATRTAGRTLQKSTFTTSKGPVGISVTVQPDPIIIYNNDKTFSLNIKLTNLATGTIYKPDNITYSESPANKQIFSDALNKVKIDINKTSDLDLTNADECTTDYQELVAGRPTTIICNFNIVGSVTNFKSFPINIAVSYGYFTERKVDVTVQGK